jgi:tRNA threonylcarbamoyladenosine biosynthesis protein TsaE
VTGLEVHEAQPADAADVVAVIHRAFGARPRLDPPSTATDETAESVAAALADSGGLLARSDGGPVGAMLFDTSKPGRLGLRRVGVDPAAQAHGVASAMVGVAEDVAERRGLDGVWLNARVELPATIEFWRRRGYWPQADDGPNVVLGKSLWLARELPTADDARAFGEALAALLAAGDLIVLSGELGAGKTTLTQGIGAGLGVRGDITSPTFVIARVHPSITDGPALVHADAYRLGGVAELDDLDLDASLDTAVTVVEWGEGIAEGLADDRLEVRIDRLRGDGSCPGDAALAAAGPRCPGDAALPVDDARRRSADSRVVSVRPHGRRWSAAPLRSTLLT